MEQIIEYAFCPNTHLHFVRQNGASNKFVRQNHVLRMNLSDKMMLFVRQINFWQWICPTNNSGQFVFVRQKMFCANRICCCPNKFVRQNVRQMMFCCYLFHQMTNFVICYLLFVPCANKFVRGGGQPID